MNFKEFYKHIYFDIDKNIYLLYSAKQGDTKSRGFYVTLLVNSVQIPVTNQTLTFYAEKPDKTRVMVQAIKDDDIFRVDLPNQAFAVAGVLKCELTLRGQDGEQISNKTFKMVVDASIQDGSIISKDERGILDRAFELAEDIIPRLELLDVELLEDVQAEMLGARHSGTKDATYDSLGQRLDAAEQDLLDHKAEYTSNRQQDQLKVAKVEKELNDYKSTIAGINVNQEAKQVVSGYGVVSLPPNAANGQVSTSVKGRTLKNELNYNRDTWAEWTKSAGVTGDSTGLNFQIDVGEKIATLQFPLVKGSTKYGILLNAISNTLTLPFLRNSALTGSASTVIPAGTVGNVKHILATQANIVLKVLSLFTQNNEVSGKQIKIGDIRVFELPTGSEIENDFNTMTADQLANKYPYIKGDSTKSTVGAMRLKSVSADETETSTAYVTAKDGEGKIAELRSLPNETKDEIRVSGGKAEHIQRNKKYVLQASDIDAIYTLYTNVDLVRIGEDCLVNLKDAGSTEHGLKATLEGFKPMSAPSMVDSTSNTNCIRFSGGQLQVIVAKGTYTSLTDAQSKLTGLELTYQLAEPEIIPIQVSGSLTGHPNGTVFIEPIVADAGIYGDKMEVLHQDLPIKAIENVSKVDFLTGVETELDIEGIVIAENKLSFTHPDLSDGDIVFFEYEYDREGTTPETEIEYYDSRYTIKDSVTDKFYKWNVTVADGVPSIELVEV